MPFKILAVLAAAALGCTTPCVALHGARTKVLVVPLSLPDRARLRTFMRANASYASVADAVDAERHVDALSRTHMPGRDEVASQFTHGPRWNVSGVAWPEGERVAFREGRLWWVFHPRLDDRVDLVLVSEGEERPLDACPTTN